MPKTPNSYNKMFAELTCRQRQLREAIAQMDELREAWRTNVGDGTDKLTAASLVSLLEDYRTELADARAERDEARKEVERLLAESTDVTDSCGNVFADLGLPNAEELQQQAREKYAPTEPPQTTAVPARKENL